MSAVPVGPDEKPNAVLQGNFFKTQNQIDGRLGVVEKSGTSATGIIVQSVTAGDTSNSPSGDAVYDFVEAKRVTATAILNFPSIAAGGGIQALTVAVTGAVTGDAVSLGPPSTIEAGLIWSAFVSAADTVTIRLCNTTAVPIDPASTTWRVTVFK